MHRQQTACLLLLLVTLPFFTIMLPCSADSWNTQTVTTSTGDAGILAFDSNNRPHICFTEYEQNLPGYEEIMYASWNGNSWNIQNVTPGVAYDFVIDSYNIPHILYHTVEAPIGLYYASLNGSTWTSQLIDPNGWCGTLVLDSKDNPHVAYVGSENYLYYAYENSTGWTIQVVDPTFVEDFHTFLALDQNGNPRILYGVDSYQSQTNIGGGLTEEENGSCAVKYAVENSGSGWSIETVLPSIPISAFGNLVLDSNGYPHFIYEISYPVPWLAYSESLMYESWNGTNWTSQLVASNVSLDRPMGRLALDRSNNPYIDFLNQNLTEGVNAGSMFLALRNGSNWQLQTVVATNATTPGDIVIDQNGVPHITYFVSLTTTPPYQGFLEYTTTFQSNGSTSSVTTITASPTPSASAFPSNSPKVPELQTDTLFLAMVLFPVILLSLKLKRTRGKSP